MLHEKTAEFIKEVKEFTEESIMSLVGNLGYDGITDLLEDESGIGKTYVKGLRLIDNSYGIILTQAEILDTLVEQNAELNRKLDKLIERSNKRA